MFEVFFMVLVARVNSVQAARSVSGAKAKPFRDVKPLFEVDPRADASLRGRLVRPVTEDVARGLASRTVMVVNQAHGLQLQTSASTSTVAKEFRPTHDAFEGNGLEFGSVVYSVRQLGGFGLNPPTFHVEARFVPGAKEYYVLLNMRAAEGSQP